MMSRRAVIASGERSAAWRSSARGCMACGGDATLVSGCTMNTMTRMVAAASATTPATIGRIAPLIDLLIWAPVVLGQTVGKLRQDDVLRARPFDAPARNTAHFPQRSRFG